LERGGRNRWGTGEVATAAMGFSPLCFFRGGGEKRKQVKAWRAEGGGVVVLVPEIKRGRERGPRRQQRARSSCALSPLERVNDKEIGKKRKGMGQIGLEERKGRWAAGGREKRERKLGQREGEAQGEGFRGFSFLFLF
jgi:hypothetical protein